MGTQYAKVTTLVDVPLTGGVQLFDYYGQYGKPGGAYDPTAVGEVTYMDLDDAVTVDPAEVMIHVNHTVLDIEDAVASASSAAAEPPPPPPPPPPRSSTEYPISSDESPAAED